MQLAVELWDILRRRPAQGDERQVEAGLADRLELVAERFPQGRVAAPKQRLRLRGASQCCVWQRQRSAANSTTSCGQVIRSACRYTMDVIQDAHERFRQQCQPQLMPMNKPNDESCNQHALHRSGNDPLAAC